MATFDDTTVGANTTPDFSAVKRSQPRQRKVVFGDGYEQRLSFGLNQNPKEWSLTWQYLTTANANAIEAFFDARADDAASFNWTPPDTTTSYKWLCDEWQRELVAANLETITATFREVYEP